MSTSYASLNSDLKAEPKCLCDRCILGLPATGPYPSDRAISLVFRKAARILHPDKNFSDSAMASHRMALLSAARDRVVDRKMSPVEHQRADEKLHTPSFIRTPSPPPTTTVYYEYEPPPRPKKPSSEPSRWQQANKKRKKKAKQWDKEKVK